MKARKEEEARRREAELLNARKAYFEERKQAAARLQQLYTPSVSNQAATNRCGVGERERRAGTARSERATVMLARMAGVFMRGVECCLGAWSPGACRGALRVCSGSTWS
jgi:hypothetical protein